MANQKTFRTGPAMVQIPVMEYIPGNTKRISDTPGLGKAQPCLVTTAANAAAKARVGKRVTFHGVLSDHAACALPYR